MYRTRFICLLLIACLSWQCSGVSQGDELSSSLMKSKSALLCQLQQLNSRNEALWQETTDFLIANLPKDIPDNEREGMIGIKNAHIFKMYKSYPTLPDSIKTRMKVVGLKDLATTDTLKTLSIQLDSIHTALTERWAELEKNNSPTVLALKKKVSTIEANPCSYNEY